MTTKMIDAKGRLMMGRGFAGKMVMVDDSDPDKIIITTAVPIPVREAWLYENDRAINLVRAGLKQARQLEFVEGPDLKVDARLAAKCDD
jgi:hypothetical protein